MISIVMATYNRGHTLARAVDSVIRQTRTDWELIVVDDGSTDNTREVLASYSGEQRIRVLSHGANKGVCAAKNTGLECVRGDWFTMLDSDDEMLPRALETLLSVPSKIDPNINAVTCNCIDAQSRHLTGLGMDADGYLRPEDVVGRLRGEHWGLTRTALLGGLRFNEAIRGGEDVLWYRINKGATRYYIHQGLRIYHTEGADRISSRGALNVEAFIRSYAAYASEVEYLGLLKRWAPTHYRAVMVNIALAFAVSGRRRDAMRAALAAMPTWGAKALLLAFVLVAGRRLGRVALETVSRLR